MVEVAIQKPDITPNPMMVVSSALDRRHIQYSEYTARQQPVVNSHAK